MKTQLARWLDFETKPTRRVWSIMRIGPRPSATSISSRYRKALFREHDGREGKIRARMEDRVRDQLHRVQLHAAQALILRLAAITIARCKSAEAINGATSAGIDLCRKLGKTVYGLTLPLVTNADGTKFGKPKRAPSGWIEGSSVYRFYQFWIRTDDRDVARYLKFHISDAR